MKRFTLLGLLCFALPGCNDKVKEDGVLLIQDAAELVKPGNEVKDVEKTIKDAVALVEDVKEHDKEIDHPIGASL